MNRKFLLLLVSLSVFTLGLTVDAQYVCENPEKYDGKVVGDGECVAFVKEAAGAPRTAFWRRGIQVKGKDIEPGTAIATFDSNGRFLSHAAIYLKQDPNKGLYVYDQWLGKPVGKRWISFKRGNNDPSNDGDEFSVIE